MHTSDESLHLQTHSKIKFFKLCWKKYKGLPEVFFIPLIIPTCARNIFSIHVGNIMGTSKFPCTCTDIFEFNKLYLDGLFENGRKHNENKGTLRCQHLSSAVLVSTTVSKGFIILYLS